MSVEVLATPLLGPPFQSDMQIIYYICFQW